MNDEVTNLRQSPDYYPHLFLRKKRIARRIQDTDFLVGDSQ
jgi:hypothetical protein